MLFLVSHLKKKLACDAEKNNLLDLKKYSNNESK